MIRQINKATDGSTTTSTSGNGNSFSLMGEGPYAFKTLWQEITKGIQAIMGGITNISTTRNNNSAAIAQTYWLTAREGATKTTGNTGFYIIVGLMIAAVFTVIIMNNKKTK